MLINLMNQNDNDFNERRFFFVDIFYSSLCNRLHRVSRKPHAAAILHDKVCLLLNQPPEGGGKRE